MARIPKTNSKATILVLIVLGLITLTVKLCRKSVSTGASSSSSSNRIDHRQKDFRRHTLEFTEHARCRMDCRKISEAEVQEVVANGTINQAKSKKSDKPCPTYAVEDYVDGKKLRVVVGDCKDDAVIITVIDLDHEFECHCPGDENKK